MPQWVAMLSLLAAMAMSGANVPVGKAIVAEIPVAAFLLIRFALSSVLLACLAPFEAGPRLTQLSLRHWLQVLVLALVGSVLFTAFLLEGLRRSSAADAGIITATLPAVIVVFGVIAGVWPERREIAMVALAVAGVGLINVGGMARVSDLGASMRTGQVLADHILADHILADHILADHILAGHILVGLAVVCEAIFVVVSRSISVAMGPIRLSLAVSLAGLLCCLPLALAMWGHVAVEPVAWGNVRWTTWALTLWSIAASSIICTVLWYRAVAHVAPARAGLATAALPVSALAVSALVFGETITWYQLGGAALVVSAIAVGTVLSPGASRERT